MSAVAYIRACVCVCASVFSLFSFRYLCVMAGINLDGPLYCHRHYVTASKYTDVCVCVCVCVYFSFLFFVVCVCLRPDGPPYCHGHYFTGRVYTDVCVCVCVFLYVYLW